MEILLLPGKPYYKLNTKVPAITGWDFLFYMGRWQNWLCTSLAMRTNWVRSPDVSTRDWVKRRLINSKVRKYMSFISRFVGQTIFVWLGPVTRIGSLAERQHTVNVPNVSSSLTHSSYTPACSKAGGRISKTQRGAFNSYSVCKILAPKHCWRCDCLVSRGHVSSILRGASWSLGIDVGLDKLNCSCSLTEKPLSSKQKIRVRFSVGVQDYRTGIFEWILRIMICNIPDRE